MKIRRNLIQLCVLITGLCSTLAGWGTTRTVNSLNDNGTGTLRDSIAASAAGDTIMFTVNGTITLTNGELLVGRNLTIAGPGALNLTVSGNNSNRVFEIAANITVNLSGMTIANGAATGTNGGTTASTLAGGSGLGGGILNSGTLEVSACVLLANSATGGNGGTTSGDEYGVGGTGSGGGICNYGTLALTGCTFTGDVAGGGQSGAGTGAHVPSQSGGPANGGGLANGAGGTVMITNCTFSGNSAFGGDAGFGEIYGNGGSGTGGAVWSGGTFVTMVNCTVSGNTATGGSGEHSGSLTYGGNAIGGGVAIISGNMVLRNVIVVNDSISPGSGESTMAEPVVNGQAEGPDVSGTANSQGHNLIGETDGSSGWVGSDLTGTMTSPLNAQLGPLQNNGGTTMTLALLATSPAIDAGDDAVLSTPFYLTTDQRGVHRPNGPQVDIGAFEFGGTELVTSLGDSGLGTLRQAIASANPGDRVTFAPLVTGAIVLSSGELLVSNQISIVGPGAANLTINANQSSRVVHVNSSGSLNLFGLALANGSTTGASSSAGMGGGLFNEGSASLTDCVISNSRAVGGNGNSFQARAGAGAGGGLYNSGVVSLLRCTLSGNSTIGGVGGTSSGGLGVTLGGTGGAAYGAGFANAGVALLTNCTIAGNTALAGQGGTGYSPGTGGTAHGAGLSADSGSVMMTSCTFSSNLCMAGSAGTGTFTANPGGATGGGLFSSTNVQLQNCLIAGNQATNSPDVSGMVQSGGFNLVGIADGSAGWLSAEATNVGNLSIPINPLLGPLQNNGGSTPTMALLTGSPAIDQGNTFGLGADQRGFVRPADNPAIANAVGGDGGDIGAFEVTFVQVVLGSARYQNNQFQFMLTGQTGSNYVIQATTNLATPIWIPLITNPAPFTFVQSNLNAFPFRFYRGVSAP